MKRNELYLETPQGEFLLMPFRYGGGREGYMVQREGFKFNLTLEIPGVDEDCMILKAWGAGKELVEHLMSKTDTFKKVGTIKVGVHEAIIVKLNPDFYE